MISSLMYTYEKNTTITTPFIEKGNMDGIGQSLLFPTTRTENTGMYTCSALWQWRNIKVEKSKESKLVNLTVVGGK